MIKSVLFDLGNTLAQYYQPVDFPPILAQAIEGCVSMLFSGREPDFDRLQLQRRVDLENHEARNYRVRPMEYRLQRIFGSSVRLSSSDVVKLCRAFMAPIFTLGQVYPEVVPALRQLR